jgi:hypothetical protein
MWPPASRLGSLCRRSSKAPLYGGWRRPRCSGLVSSADSSGANRLFNPNNVAAHEVCVSGVWAVGALVFLLLPDRDVEVQLLHKKARPRDILGCSRSYWGRSWSYATFLILGFTSSGEYLDPALQDRTTSFHHRFPS